MFTKLKNISQNFIDKHSKLTKTDLTADKILTNRRQTQEKRLVPLYQIFFTSDLVNSAKKARKLTFKHFQQNIPVITFLADSDGLHLLAPTIPQSQLQRKEK